MTQNIWSPGDWNVICDVCGFRYKASKVKQRWDGLYVCERDFEQRHPMDLFQARSEQTKLPFTSPELPDANASVTYLADQGPGIPPGTFDGDLEDAVDPYAACVYYDDFTADTDTVMESWNTPLDWYFVRAVAAIDFEVKAATDRVEVVRNGNPDVTFAAKASTYGSLTDYIATATVRRTTTDDQAMIAVRCGTRGSSNFYRVGSNSSNDLLLWRCNGGATTLLKTLVSGIISINATFEASIQVSGTNPVVLTYTYDGVSDTYSDSSASRLQTGNPGISMGLDGALGTIWADDFCVKAIP